MYVLPLYLARILVEKKLSLFLCSVLSWLSTAEVEELLVSWSQDLFMFCPWLLVSLKTKEFLVTLAVRQSTAQMGWEVGQGTNGMKYC